MGGNEITSDKLQLIAEVKADSDINQLVLELRDKDKVFSSAIPVFSMLEDAKNSDNKIFMIKVERESRMPARVKFVKK